MIIYRTYYSQTPHITTLINKDVHQTAFSLKCAKFKSPQETQGACRFNPSRTFSPKCLPLRKAWLGSKHPATPRGTKGLATESCAPYLKALLLLGLLEHGQQSWQEDREDVVLQVLPRRTCTETKGQFRYTVRPPLPQLIPDRGSSLFFL